MAKFQAYILIEGEREALAVCSISIPIMDSLHCVPFLLNFSSTSRIWKISHIIGACMLAADFISDKKANQIWA